MLSKYSIRSKIIAVVGFMTVAMLGLGGFAVMEMRTINAAAHEIQASWLPRRKLIAVQLQKRRRATARPLSATRKR